MGGLLDDPNKSMFDFDITQLKGELLEHINELRNHLITKMDINDFRGYYDNIYIMIFMQ